MSVILVLITISMLVAGGFLGAFIWAIKNGQYDDTFSPSVRMLFESKKSDQDHMKKNGTQNDKSAKNSISSF